MFLPKIRVYRYLFSFVVPWLLFLPLMRRGFTLRCVTKANFLGCKNRGSSDQHYYLNISDLWHVLYLMEIQFHTFNRKMNWRALWGPMGSSVLFIKGSDRNYLPFSYPLIAQSSFCFSSTIISPPLTPLTLLPPVQRPLIFSSPFNSYLLVNPLFPLDSYIVLAPISRCVLASSVSTFRWYSTSIFMIYFCLWCWATGAHTVPTSHPLM